MNNSLTNYDSLYFSLYCDIDVGDISGGVAEYGDDKVGFDRENHFLFFYDDGYSQEWPDSTTGYFGVVFLKHHKQHNHNSGSLIFIIIFMKMTLILIHCSLELSQAVKEYLTQIMGTTIFIPEQQMICTLMIQQQFLNQV